MEITRFTRRQINESSICYVPVGKEPEIKEIDGTLEAMQELVGGNIETVPYENIRGMVCVLNEKGKIDGMDPNRLIFEGRDFIAETSSSQRSGRMKTGTWTS